MTEGSVLWFNITKGFGVVVTDFGALVFIHYSEFIYKTDIRFLKPDDRLEFDVYEMPKRLEAKNIKKL